MSDIWSSALGNIRRQLSTQDFNAWFEPIGCETVREQEIVLRVPHHHFEEWIRDRYLEFIKEELRRVTSRDYAVRFISAEAAAAHVETQAAPETPKGQAVQATLFPDQAPAAAPTPAPPPAPVGLLPQYTFPSFVVGPSNQFAHAACQAVADSPSSNYNPLFIYGGVGLGKTHLLHAIGARVHERNPVARIKYISSENYINDLITSIRLERMDEFRYRYRTECDILLIDDIQFIAGKDRTQEEFFHTFNSLYGAHKQIVVTSDQFPQEIPGLEERLRSRFQWGLIADIQAPEMETRVAILKKKADKHGMDLPDDVAMFLATAIKSNVRELEGSLIRLQAFSSLTASTVSLSMAKEVLKNLIADHGRIVTCDAIIKAVSSYFDVKISELKSPKRHKTIAYPRMIAMYLCRRLTSESFPEIGKRFGGRDHSTVINGVNKIDRLLGQDINLQKVVRDLERQLEV